MGLTRKEQAARSRQKLIDAAYELITKKGYDATSILDITQACGMSPGNFYNYFKSKEDIILALEREPYDSFVEELASTAGQPIIEQICSYIKYYVNLSVNRYGLHYNRQWYIRYMRPREEPQKLTKIEVQLQEIQKILLCGIQSGEISDSAPIEDIAQHIAFELHGMNITHIISDGTFEVEPWIDKYCDFVKNVLLKPYLIS